MLNLWLTKKKWVPLTLLLLEGLDNVLDLIVIFFMGYVVESVVIKDWQLFSYHSLLLLVFYAQKIPFRLLGSFVRKTYFINLELRLTQLTYETIYNSNPLEIWRSRGGHLSIFLNDIPTISKGVQEINSLILQIFRLLYVVVFFFIVHYYLAIALVILLCIFLIPPIFFRNKIKKLEIEITEFKRSFLEKTSNYLEGYLIYRLSGRGVNFLTNYSLAHSKILKKWFITEIQKFVMLLLGYILVAVPLTVMTVLAGWFKYLNLISIASFINVVNYSMIGRNAFRAVIRIFFSLSATKSLVNRLITKPKSMLCTKKLEAVKTISLKDVSFSFPNQPLIFKNLNLQFNKGKKYAIVGRSSRGKTTLALLLLGLYKPTSGNILWNSMNYNNFHPEQLLTQVNFLPAQSEIVMATLRDNLSHFQEKYSDRELTSVLNRLKLEHLSLNDVIDKTSVSAGEMQRIVLGRVILEPRKFLILDEAFANLDSRNKHRIENYFLSQPELTFINITHHLDNPAAYDKIINLEN